MADTQKQDSELKYFKIDVSKLASLVNQDLKNTTDGASLLSQYNKQQIIEYLQSPISSEKVLRQISRLLYNLSPQYRRLLKYFTDMARYDYVIDMINPQLIDQPKETVIKKYRKMIKSVDDMNIKHEFSKISNVCFVEDIFYGYDYSTSNSYLIQKLNPDYCRISGEADGIRTFEFDFNYFSGRNEEKLDNGYAPEFREKYEIYKKDRKQRWQELSLDHSVCIKLNEEIDYPIPFFASLFPDVFDINDYKLLKKARTEMENYVILVAKIPYMKNADKANAFALHMDDALGFGNKAISSLPDQVGFILSPYDDVNAIYLGNRTQVDSNSVAEAEQSFFNSAGVNQALFNSDKISEESIRKSIQADENLIFGLYRQLERWMNRKNKLTVSSDFKVRILNTTEFNWLEVARGLKEMAIYGIPVVREICAAVGQTPLEMENALHLESVLDFENRLKPLTSSNTMSPDKVNGRPGQEATGADNTGKKIVNE